MQRKERPNTNSQGKSTVKAESSNEENYLKQAVNLFNTFKKSKDENDLETAARYFLKVNFSTEKIEEKDSSIDCSLQDLATFFVEKGDFLTSAALWRQCALFNQHQVTSQPKTSFFKHIPDSGKLHQENKEPKPKNSKSNAHLAWKNAAINYEKLECRYLDAARSWNEAANISQDPKEWENAAKAYEQAGRFSAAGFCWDSAAQKSTNSKDKHRYFVNAASAFSHELRFAEAAYSWGKAAEVSENQALEWEKAANAHYQAKKFESAKYCFNAALCTSQDPQKIHYFWTILTSINYQLQLKEETQFCQQAAIKISIQNQGKIDLVKTALSYQNKHDYAMAGFYWGESANSSLRPNEKYSYCLNAARFYALANNFAFSGSWWTEAAYISKDASEWRKAELDFRSAGRLAEAETCLVKYLELHNEQKFWQSRSLTFTKQVKPRISGGGSGIFKLDHGFNSQRKQQSEQKHSKASRGSGLTLTPPRSSRR